MNVFFSAVSVRSGSPSSKDDMSSAEILIISQSRHVFLFASFRVGIGKHP